MKRLNILFRSSNEYIFMVGVAITSLLENASKSVNYNIYVLTKLNDLEEANKEKLLSLLDKYPDLTYSISFIDAKNIDQRLEANGAEKFRGSYASVYTLMVQSCFEGMDVDRILIVDADSIFTGSLEDIVDFDFQGNPLALTWQETMAVPKAPRDYKYFRCSLVYVDLKEWKKRDCENRALALLAKIRNSYTGMEEGIINTEFQDEITILPLKYNVYAFAIPFSYKNKKKFFHTTARTEQELKESIDNMQIVHFGRSFLYRPNEVGSKDKMSDLWWKYCNKSPWANMQRTPAGPPLSLSEKLFRVFYLLMPQCIGDALYVSMRRRHNNPKNS